MLESVTQSGERDIRVHWRFFSLSQVNSKDEGWTVWDAPESEPVNGRLAFKAAEAARRQDAFHPLHMALLNARHRDKLDIESQLEVERIASESGLDLDRFRRDLADPSILKSLAEDHEEGRSKHGVFGTPTFVFPNGGAAYVRIRQVASSTEAARILDQIVAVAEREPAILEIKRPNPPSQ